MLIFLINIRVNTILKNIFYLNQTNNSILIKLRFIIDHPYQENLIITINRYSLIYYANLIT